MPTTETWAKADPPHTPVLQSQECIRAAALPQELHSTPGQNSGCSCFMCMFLCIRTCYVYVSVSVCCVVHVPMCACVCVSLCVCLCMPNAAHLTEHCCIDVAATRRQCKHAIRGDALQPGMGGGEVAKFAKLLWLLVQTLSRTQVRYSCWLRVKDSQVRQAMQQYTVQRSKVK
jgi:hypothetical protein